MSKPKKSTTMDNSTERQKKIPINKVTEIYKCDICDKEFKKIYSLKTHINVVHMVKELQCYICQKKICITW